MICQIIVVCAVMSLSLHPKISKNNYQSCTLFEMYYKQFL